MIKITDVLDVIILVEYPTLDFDIVLSTERLARSAQSQCTIQIQNRHIESGLMNCSKFQQNYLQYLHQFYPILNQNVAKMGKNK